MTTSGLVAVRRARIRRRNGQRLLSVSALLVALAAPASAQLVPITTTPVAQGDPLLIFPSNNSGMVVSPSPWGTPCSTRFGTPRRARA